MFDWKNEQTDDSGKLIYQAFFIFYFSLYQCYKRINLRSEQCPTEPGFKINLQHI